MADQVAVPKAPSTSALARALVDVILQEPDSQAHDEATHAEVVIRLRGKTLENYKLINLVSQDDKAADHLIVETIWLMDRDFFPRVGCSMTVVALLRWNLSSQIPIRRRRLFSHTRRPW